MPRGTPQARTIGRAFGSVEGPSVRPKCHPFQVAEFSSILPAHLPAQPREISLVTRRDIFDFLRKEADPWWGRLDEISFLEQLYDLDALPSTDRRHATAGEDIARHRVANLDWDDDWVFDDQRFQLADGPDDVLLNFLARMAHPLVQPDPEQAIKLVTQLNSLLALDGWELRTSGFISGRPFYGASRTPGGAGTYASPETRRR